jgi:hypothetical protein
MVLQRIGTVSCPDAPFDPRFHQRLDQKLDHLDVYELRMWPDGPPVVHADMASLDAVQERPGYRIAMERLRAPMASYVADKEGGYRLRLSALRSSQGGGPGPALLQV